jgi:hypothetical protein
VSTTRADRPGRCLQGADHEGIRGEGLTRPLALDMALADAEVELLEERRLLGAEFDHWSASLRSSASRRSYRVPSPL